MIRISYHQRGAEQSNGAFLTNVEILLTKLPPLPGSAFLASIMHEMSNIRDEDSHHVMADLKRYSMVDGKSVIYANRSFEGMQCKSKLSIHISFAHWIDIKFLF